MPISKQKKRKEERRRSVLSPLWTKRGEKKWKTTQEKGFTSAFRKRKRGKGSDFYREKEKKRSPHENRAQEKVGTSLGRKDGTSRREKEEVPSYSTWKRKGRKRDTTPSTPHKGGEKKKKTFRRKEGSTIPRFRGKKQSISL